jgi:hypothetical protein
MIALLVSMFRRSAAFVNHACYPRLAPWATDLAPLRGWCETPLLLRVRLVCLKNRIQIDLAVK